MRAQRYLTLSINGNIDFTIKDLYFAFRSKTAVGKKYRQSGYPKIHAMIDGRIKLDKIKDIVFNGKKPVFRIVTENGFNIKSTDNHRFLSEFGWRMVKDFRNFVMHEYFGVDAKIVWDLTHLELDELVANIKNINL